MRAVPTEELDGLLPFATEAEAQAIRAIIANHGDYRDAAVSLGIHYEALRARVRECRKRASTHSPGPVIVAASSLSGLTSCASSAVSCSTQMTPDRTFIERVKPRPVSEGLPISETGRTTFVISDMHVPFHDPQVWATKLAIIKFLRPEAVVIIGDWWDNYAASFFPKDPTRKSRIIDEVNEGLPLLDELEALGVPNVFFLEGNHEERLGRIVVQLAPMLHGMVKTLPEIGRIAERGWHWIPYKRSIAIGKMRYSHDFTRCGVNAGRQALLDVGKSVTFGHTHRLGVAYQGTIEDDGHVSLNVGWGGDFAQVDYAHRDRARRDWMHGCGIVDEDERGFVWPQSVAIINGTAVVRGQRVTA
jgi:predicted phosphodiesterase